jgi:hypothetical protein
VPEKKVGSIKQMLHDFFISNYNAYTFENSEIQGFWRRDFNSPIFDDRNVKYVVSFDGKDRVCEFIDFLSEVCYFIDEECIYLTMGQESWLVKPSKRNDKNPEV